MFAALLVSMIAVVGADVEVTIEAPKTVELTPADKPGGKTGEVTIKVKVKNTGTDAIVFSQSKVKVTVLQGKKEFTGGYNAEPKKTTDAGQLQNGQARTADRTITFHTITVDAGEKLTIVAEFEGVKAEKEITVKGK